MNAKPLSQKLGVALAILLGVLASACGPQEELTPTGSSGQELAQAKRDQGAVITCDYPVPPGPVDIGAIVVELETDRIYKSARPGFVREWLPAGWKDGGLFGIVAVQFDSIAHAQEFSDWLDNGFILDGVRFWDRPDFSLGHTCHIYEVIGAESNQAPADSQVTMRVERFPVSGYNARAQLKAWYEQLQVESRREGDVSLYVLYSESEQQASVVYFQDVPQAQRVALGPVPVAERPPFASGDVFDWSGWNFSTSYPFVTGDQGKPAAWPLPGIAPWAGDGLCEVSRHETWHNTTDCLATCGNGVPDSGETAHNCPGDVPL